MLVNLLRGNVKLTPCQKRKLRKHRVHLRKLADKRVSLPSKKAIVQRGGFFFPLLGAVLPTIASLIFMQLERERDMLRKMYLVSPDYLNTVTSKNTPQPPPQSRNTEKAGKKHNCNKRLRSVKKIKTKKREKYLSQREHDRWVAKHSAARRGRDYDKWFKYVANFTRRISKERTR